MQYMIRNAKTGMYVSAKNGISKWTNKGTASKFKSKSNAENYVGHNLKSAGIASKDLEIIPCMKVTQSSDEKKSVDEAFGSIKELTDNVMSQIQAYMEACNVEIQRSDAMQQDILHKAELENLNASDGFKIYKALHEVRVYRRRYKNIRTRLGYAMTHCKNVVSTFDKDYEPLYEPRVIGDTFSKSVSDILDYVSDEVNAMED